LQHAKVVARAHHTAINNVALFMDWSSDALKNTLTELSEPKSDLVYFTATLGYECWKTNPDDSSLQNLILPPYKSLFFQSMNLKCDPFEMTDFSPKTP